MDPNYQFYLHIEDLKNSLYRQLSSARQPNLFWPKSFYSWFYANEKTLFNILNLRQKLGRDISEKEIDSYNHIRDQIIPKSPYVIAKRNIQLQDRKEYFKALIFSDVTWRRKSYFHLYLAPFALIAISRALKLPNWWIAASFVPSLILHFSDRHFPPYSELENFYKYVYERRKAETFYKEEKEQMENELKQLNSPELEDLKIELERTNRTLYEVVQNIDEMYLDAAINFGKNVQKN